MGIFEKLKKTNNATPVDDTTHDSYENSTDDEICPQQGKIYTLANA